MNYSDKKGINRLVGRELTPQQRKKIDFARKLYIPTQPKQPRPKTADTIERESLHNRIKELVSQGKGNIEILSTLANEFPDSKLQSFFESYIEHHRQKLSKQEKIDEGHSDR